MPSDVLPTHKRASTRSYRFRRVRPSTILLAVLAIIAIWLVFAHHTIAIESGHEWVLVSTPGASHPLALIDLKRDHHDVLHPLSIEDPAQVIGKDFSPTHITRHPKHGAVLYITNEVRNGSVVAVQLYHGGTRWSGSGLLDEMVTAKVLGIGRSGGDEPCHALVSRDGQWLLVANYGSPTVALHHLPGLDDPHVLNLPLIDTGSGEAIISHPHQVIQHPGKGDTFFVTDLGQDVVHTLTIKEGRLVYQDAWKAEGSELHGIRHGVFDDTNRNIFFTYQNSAAILPVPFSPVNHLLPQWHAAANTLPRTLRAEAGGQDVGDIKILSSGTVVAANRRIAPPFPTISSEVHGVGGDTLVLMEHGDGALHVRGHVEIGCWQPRELLPLPLVQKGLEQVLVTCHGAEGKGGGVRLVEVIDQRGTKQGRVSRAWETSASVMGVSWVT